MNKPATVMQSDEYSVMFEAEENHWWYRGLRDFIGETLRWIEKNGSRLKEMRLLDAGCGTGANLQEFAGRFAEAAGFDLSTEAVQFCRQRGLASVQQASIAQMPFGENNFDLIVSMDVLCVLDEESRSRAWRELSRVLKPGGFFVFNLPAYQFLLSEHDAAVQTRHRFTRRKLAREMAAAGLAPVQISYRNTFLFPPLALIRLLKKMKLSRKPASQIHSDLRPVPPIVNRLFTGILKLENKVMRWVSLPFGLSVCGVARKK